MNKAQNWFSNDENLATVGLFALIFGIFTFGVIALIFFSPIILGGLLSLSIPVLIVMAVLGAVFVLFLVSLPTIMLTLGTIGGGTTIVLGGIVGVVLLVFWALTADNNVDGSARKANALAWE